MAAANPWQLTSQTNRNTVIAETRQLSHTMLDVHGDGRNSWYTPYVNTLSPRGKGFAGVSFDLSPQADQFLHLAGDDASGLPRIMPSAATYVLFQSRAAKERYRNAQSRASLLHDFTGSLSYYRSREVGTELEPNNPIHDEAGNVLSGDAAWQRRIDLYNHWYCIVSWRSVVDGKTQNQRIAEAVQQFVAEALAAVPDTKELAAELYFEGFDDATLTRKDYLFRSDAPNNQYQQDAWFAMRKLRQGLQRGFDSAADPVSMKPLLDTAVTAVNGVTVAHSPVWEGDSQPLPAQPWRYTKGTGRRAWKQHVHAHTRADAAAGITTDAQRLAQGQCVIAPLEDDDFELVMGTSTPAGGQNATIQRKTGTTGHPAAGTYRFTLTARNDNGPTTLDVSIVVGS